MNGRAVQIEEGVGDPPLALYRGVSGFGAKRGCQWWQKYFERCSREFERKVEGRVVRDDGRARGKSGCREEFRVVEACVESDLIAPLRQFAVQPSRMGSIEIVHRRLDTSFGRPIIQVQLKRTPVQVLGVSRRHFFDSVTNEQLHPRRRAGKRCPK